jgi:uncharacterized phage-associated protein
MDKAIEVLLYITQRQQDMYTALKVLYFADKAHLSQYGRFICGESYVAMSHGPVPSGTYDIIKYVRGDGWCLSNNAAQACFRVSDNQIAPLRDPNLDMLSASDIECLDAAIEHYGHLSFSELRRQSHDKAYQSADKNDFISVESIAQSLPDGDLLLEYLQEC